jgi:hypothetical protein
MRRIAISISCLDDDDRFDCLFGNKQCLIIFNDKVVGRAFRHDKIYLLSIKDFINVVSSENNVNVSSSKNKRKKLMTYLRNYGTVAWATFRGGIERLVKELILLPLEFSKFKQCKKKCRDIRNNSYGYLRSVSHSIRGWL